MKKQSETDYTARMMIIDDIYDETPLSPEAKAMFPDAIIGYVRVNSLLDTYFLK